VKRARDSAVIKGLVLAIGLTWASAMPAAARPTASRPQAAKHTVRKSTAPRPTTKTAKRPVRRRTRVPETPIPRYKIDETGALVPDLHAAAAIIYNPETQQILWEENSQNQRSIASITKVMTATVIVETDPDLSRQIVIERVDTRAASTTLLRTGDRVTVGDLLHLALISSDNAAARALARTSPWGASGFIRRMNEKARELGLQNTRYADPSGLLSDNVSSAYDMARLIAYAAGDERMSSIMRKPEYRIWTGRRMVTAHSTNMLLRRTDLGDLDVKGGKTGFISKSGYCFATLLSLPQFNQQVAVVVLGARSNTGRFLETRNIINWLSTKAQDLFRRDDSR
jgi:serine-type D-Ala-D-Ala endopeptidase (penicillin-binding protein 7)